MRVRVLQQKFVQQQPAAPAGDEIPDPGADQVSDQIADAHAVPGGKIRVRRGQLREVRRGQVFKGGRLLQLPNMHHGKMARSNGPLGMLGRRWLRGRPRDESIVRNVPERLGHVEHRGVLPQMQARDLPGIHVSARRGFLQKTFCVDGKRRVAQPWPGYVIHSRVLLLLQSHDRTHCKSCKSGQYQNEQGAESCKVCPTGYYSYEQDNRFLTSCKGCNSGRYQEKKGQSKCKVCALGKYHHQGAASDCKSCPATWFSFDYTYTGAPGCPVVTNINSLGLNCDAQIALEAARNRVVTCATLKNQCYDCTGCSCSGSGGPATNCYDFRLRARNYRCYQCPRGWYMNGAKTACIDCPKGYYQDTPGASDCKACPSHFWICRASELQYFCVCSSPRFLIAEQSMRCACAILIHDRPRRKMERRQGLRR